MRFRSFNLAAAATIGLVATTAGLWGVVALTAPNSAVASRSGLATVHENRAEQALTSAPLSEANLETARTESLRGLSLSPTNPWGGLRLAYVEHARAGRLGPRGLAALQQSYDVSPYGPQVSPWRITFAFDQWAELTPDLRRQTASELRVVGPHHPHMAQVAVSRITDRQGRLAARTVLVSVEARHR